MIEHFQDFAARHDVEMHSAKQVISGGIAGCFSKSAVAPLSRVTILMQVQSMRPHKFRDGSTPNNKSLFASLQKIYIQQGVAGYWVGNGAMLVHRFPYTGITFCMQDWVKRSLHTFPQAPEEFHALVAGASSSMVAVTVCYPLDVVRTRLSSQTGKKQRTYYSGIIDALSKIWKDEGMRGYYKGLSVAYVSAVPTIALNFAFYDYFLRLYSSSRMPVTLQSLGAGATAGALASTLIFPMDLLRRQMQMLGVGGRPDVYGSVFDAVSKVYASGQKQNPTSSWRVFFGLREFYRGLLPELIKVTPAVAILFHAQTWLMSTKWWLEK